MQFYLRRFSFFKSFLPTRCAQAPLIASLEACKAVLGHRGGKVIAGSFRELKELIGHDGAHGMNPNIIATNFTAASSVETCYW
jgi:hypothetical protein